MQANDTDGAGPLARSKKKGKAPEIYQAKESPQRGKALLRPGKPRPSRKEPIPSHYSPPQHQPGESSSGEPSSGESSSAAPDSPTNKEEDKLFLETKKTGSKVRDVKLLLEILEHIENLEELVAKAAKMPQIVKLKTILENLKNIGRLAREISWNFEDPECIRNKYGAVEWNSSSSKKREGRIPLENLAMLCNMAEQLNIQDITEMAIDFPKLKAKLSYIVREEASHVKKEDKEIFKHFSSQAQTNLGPDNLTLL